MEANLSLSETESVESPPSSLNRKRRQPKVNPELLDEEEYKRRRARNNEAVKKCRIKSRLKTKEMADKVTLLREENDMLSQKVQILTKELTLLKDMFLTHATGSLKSGSGVKKIFLVNAAAVKSDHGYSIPKIPKEVKPEPSESDMEAIVDLSMRSRPGIVVEKSSSAEN